MRVGAVNHVCLLAIAVLLLPMAHGFAEFGEAQEQPPTPRSQRQTSDQRADYSRASSDGARESEAFTTSVRLFDDCPLPPPTLVSPIGGVTVNTLVPYLEWSGTGTHQYHIQVSMVSDFSTLTFEQFWSGLSGDDVYIEWHHNLSPNTTYYWRVASRCSGGSSAFSAVESFSTSNITGPFLEPPPMTAPSDGAALSSLSVTFSWGDTPGAVAPQLRWYRTLADAHNDTGAAIRWWDGWVNGTTLTLGHEGTWYWRILVRDDTAWGPLSPVRSFTVTVPSFSVSGQIADESSNPIPGVTVVSSYGGSAMTDASGGYTLTDHVAGTHTITPSLHGWSFTPPTRTVTLPPDATGQDFSGVTPKLRLLFVPLRWQETQQAFDTEVDAQVDLFLSDVPLGGCRNRVLIEKLDVATQGFDEFTCTYPNDCGVGTIEPFVRDVLEIDPADYDIVVGLAATSPCSPIAGCSNGTDNIWVASAYDIVAAHEIGHIYGLEDEYCSNQAGSTDTRCNDGDSQADGAATGDINWLDAGLPPDCPPDGSDDSGGSACCNFDSGHDCSAVNYGVCCYGNHNSAGGRATMSYANAPGPRGFDDHSIAHLSGIPELSCDSALTSPMQTRVHSKEDGSQRIIDANLLMYQDDSVVEQGISIRQGRPTWESVLDKEAGEYSLEVTDVGGGALWSHAFDVFFDYDGPVILGVDYSGVSYDTAHVSYRIPYEDGMATLMLYHGEDLIFSKRLPVERVYLPVVLRAY